MASPLPRTIASRITDFLDTFRVVLLEGARQTGKTTLVTRLLDLPDDARFTFDDADVLERAQGDPKGFLEAVPQPAIIDEFQRAGAGFLLAIKQRVDRDPVRGQLLLTGSANYRATRQTTDTLAGRMGRLAQWPFSEGEIRGIRETFVDHLFDRDAWPPTGTDRLTRADAMQLVLRGGFPDIVTGDFDERRRQDWFRSYVADVVSQEALRSIAEIRGERELGIVLQLLAARSANELVITDIASDAGLARGTTSDYIALLQALHLVVTLPAWSTSATTRAKRRPKIHLVDSGLAANLCGIGEPDLRATATGGAAGALLETYVVSELQKQASWSHRVVDLSHFQDRRGGEIDVVLQDRRSGQVAGIEIKATASPSIRHVRHLERIRDRLGEQFTLGVLLHTGTNVLPLGDRLWALPVASLWRCD